ncbi:MAG: NUDIX pyrophosphatase [Candidatus Hodarchaeota archaeon]
MVDRINVQVFIFTKNPKFMVLILKRVPEREGHWQPITGGIKEGEKPIDTIKREIYEETGIQELKRIIDLRYSFFFKTMWRGKLAKMKEHCFAAEIKEEKAIQLSSEHEEYRWCTIGETKEALKWRHNLIAFHKLLDILNLEDGDLEEA